MIRKLQTHPGTSKPDKLQQFGDPGGQQGHDQVEGAHTKLDTSLEMRLELISTVRPVTALQYLPTRPEPRRWLIANYSYPFTIADKRGTESISWFIVKNLYTVNVYAKMPFV